MLRITKNMQLGYLCILKKPLIQSIIEYLLKKNEALWCARCSKWLGKKLPLEQKAICQYWRVFFGVTQCHLWGSAGVNLGPTLFILYINDICSVSNLVKCILFADDTNVFDAGDNQLELECMLYRDLPKLCKLVFYPCYGLVGVVPTRVVLHYVLLITWGTTHVVSSK